MKFINIAIDGPSGAGKSTISKEIAKKLGFIYIDTGAMYRAIGLYAKNKGLSLEESGNVENYLDEISIDIKHTDKAQRIYLNGVDVSEEIRLDEISMYASKVSAVPKVREFLFTYQQKLAMGNNCIMDGRDIGSVILPNADIKIFLTASSKSRAIRRYEELISRGQDVTFEKVLEDIILRDKNDSSRDVAPLKPADDAIIIDTSGNTFIQSVNIIEKTIKDRLLCIEK